MFILIPLFCIGALFLILFLIPKFTTGRILFTESFIPELQVYHPQKKEDLNGIPVKIEILNRKLYRIKLFLLFKPIMDLLPNEYTVKSNKNGLFVFWAYPFDVVNIIIGENKFRRTYTLRHKVSYFGSRQKNYLLAVLTLFFPKILHGECIEIPTTLGSTCGYADKLCVFPGENINLRISTKEDNISIELVRVGKELTKKIDGIKNIAGNYQCIETLFPSAFGCGWKSTYKYKLPDELSSGCYLIKLKGEEFDNGAFIPLIIKPKKIQNNLAVIASTNTWHAYNSWGGQNYYINYTSFPSKYIISKQRPLDLYYRNPIDEECKTTRDHLLVGERFIWAWLEREKIGYDLYSDLSLHRKEEFEKYLKKYKIILISTHSEYWSYEMIDHLKQFIQNGGHVISLSGNNVYKEVKFVDENLIVLDGAYFRYQNFYSETIFGIAHDLKGFFTWAPYKVLKANHWAFKGTNLKNGELFGQKGQNVSPKDVSGASGWETDKISTYSHKNTILLARGTNLEGLGLNMVIHNPKMPKTLDKLLSRKGGGADMTIFKETDGGYVFSVGSISYGGSLLIDKNISKITKNVINKFLSI
jgi:hypothetical protein